MTKTTSTLTTAAPAVETPIQQEQVTQAMDTPMTEAETTEAEQIEQEVASTAEAPAGVTFESTYAVGDEITTTKGKGMVTEIQFYGSGAVKEYFVMIGANCVSITEDEILSDNLDEAPADEAPTE